MHNKNISVGYYTYHLFCLFLQFFEAFKQLTRAAFVQNVIFSHIFKEIGYCLEKIPCIVSIVL